MRCRIGEVRRSAFQVAFEMAVGDRVAAEGYGWLVGFDYAAQESARLPVCCASGWRPRWPGPGWGVSGW